jgi:hypothetical protein
MVQLAKDGYRGPCPALMLSAREEFASCSLDAERFDWTKVSVNDKRIRSSQWYDSNEGKYPKVTTKFGASAIQPTLI